jgi:hypothetical protein
MQIRTRPLEQRELDEADRIIQLAFVTFFGLPDPMKMFGDNVLDPTGTNYKKAHLFCESIFHTNSNVPCRVQKSENRIEHYK